MLLVHICWLVFFIRLRPTHNQKLAPQKSDELATLTPIVTSALPILLQCSMYRRQGVVRLLLPQRRGFSFTNETSFKKQSEIDRDEQSSCTESAIKA